MGNKLLTRLNFKKISFPFANFSAGHRSCLSPAQLLMGGQSPWMLCSSVADCWAEWPALEHALTTR